MIPHEHVAINKSKVLVIKNTILKRHDTNLHIHVPGGSLRLSWGGIFGQVVSEFCISLVWMLSTSMRIRLRQFNEQRAAVIEEVWTIRQLDRANAMR